MNEVPQDPFYHAEGNVAVHTKMVLDALTNEATFDSLNAQDREILWAAALLHDVEKYSTTLIDADGRISSAGHAKKGAQSSRNILFNEIPTPFYIREQIVGLVRHHGLPIWLFEKPDPLKSLVKASMEVSLQLLTILARADMLGRICADQEEMLYRIDCFEAYCKEQNCWDSERLFATPQAKMYYFEHEKAFVDYVPFNSPSFQVMMMSGLPGAGKDSYIRQNFKEFPVVSLDEIRKQMGIKPTDKSGNGKVVQAAKELSRTHLRKKQTFVWNATNITQQMRSQLIELFTSYGAEVNIIYLEVPYVKLHQQNKNREEQVPDYIIDKLIQKLEVPKVWEAHQVYYCI